MTVDLEGMQDVVAKRTKECQELLVVIVEKKMHADEKQRTLEADSQRIADPRSARRFDTIAGGRKGCVRQLSSHIV